MTDLGKKKLLSPEDALQIIFAETQASLEVEQLPLGDSAGRVLAEDIVSTIPVPPADNSAMDGYAVCSADIDPDRDTELEVSMRIPAGVAPEALKPGTAARIFTGAPMPEGADAVIMQEHCQVQGARVLLPAGVECGRNVRRQGGELKIGAKVLDNASIEDFAVVKGPKTVISDNARLTGQAYVSGNVKMGGYTRVLQTINAPGKQVIPNEVPLRPGQKKGDGEKPRHRDIWGCF